MILEIELLKDYEVQKIQQYLQITRYNKGTISTGENKNVKLCDVVDQSSIEYKKIYQILSNAISNSSTFSSLLSIKKITPPMVVNYGKGAFYDWHVDELEIGNVLTHYSMTIFLNDPENYKGGELTLIRDNKEEKYKLKAGNALIYSTGMLHKVNKVDEGNRFVSVCWLESLIKDEFIRTCIFDIGKINQDFMNENVSTEKILKLEQLRINMMRHYGNF